MRSPMGDGARRLALDVGTFKVAARRTLRCGVGCFAANPEAIGGVTAEGGGAEGSGGEELFVLAWREGCVKKKKKKQLRQIYFIWIEMTDPKAPSEREAA